MKLLKAIATVGGLTMLSRLAGFVRDILTASILGAGFIADAFFVALKLPNFFRRITAEGAFSISFIPVFSQTLENEGRKEAQEFARNMMGYMVFILTPVCLLAMLAMPWVIYGIAPGFANDPVRYDLAVELSRITFPYLLFISMTALVGGVLNAVDRYAPFAAAPVFFNLCLIIALLTHQLSGGTPAHAMAWAVTISGVVQLAWVYFFARKEGFSLRVQWPKVTERSRRMLRLMIPGLVGAGVMHINLFVDVVLASLLPAGSVSYLYYADRLTQLPLGVIGIAIGTALLPMLSRAIAGGRTNEARDLFNRSFEFALLLVLPAGLALMVIAYPIVAALFQHGAFERFDAVVTAYVLMAYAAGLPAYVLSKVFSAAFYANQDTKTPVKIAIVVALFNLGMSLFLIQYFKVMGIAAATSMAGWLQLVMLWLAARRFDGLTFDARLRRAIPRVVLSASAMTSTLLTLMVVMKGWINGDDVSMRVMALALIIGGGGVVYGAMVFLTRAISVQDIRKAVTKTASPSEMA